MINNDSKQFDINMRYLTPSNKTLEEHQGKFLFERRTYTYNNRLKTIIFRQWNKLLKLFNVNQQAILTNKDALIKISHHIASLEGQLQTGNLETIKKIVCYIEKQIGQLSHCLSLSSQIEENERLNNACHSLKNQVTESIQNRFNQFMALSETTVLPDSLVQKPPVTTLISIPLIEQVNQTIRTLLGKEGLKLWEGIMNSTVTTELISNHPIYKLKLEHSYEYSYQRRVITGTMHLPKFLTIRFSKSNGNKKLDFLTTFIILKGFGQEFKLESLIFSADDKLTVKISKPGWAVKKIVEKGIHQSLKHKQPSVDHSAQTFDNGFTFAFSYILTRMKKIDFKWVKK